ncbi:MAG: hypothetical protein IIA60_02855 [Candidatus Marinimicrobia bacterium]|nr:hypothetical protein [Candidatus Neomarinimicrobiota bacterium]
MAVGSWRGRKITAKAGPNRSPELVEGLANPALAGQADGGGWSGQVYIATDVDNY